MIKKYSSMAQILDSPIEEVALELEKLTYGELTNFKKMLEMQYLELEYTKENLKELDSKEADTLIEEFYILLQKVEDIARITEELKKQKEVKI